MRSGVGFKLHTCFIIGMLVFWIINNMNLIQGPCFLNMPEHTQITFQCEKPLQITPIYLNTLNHVGSHATAPPATNSTQRKSNMGRTRTLCELPVSEVLQFHSESTWGRSQDACRMNGGLWTCTPQPTFLRIFLNVVFERRCEEITHYRVVFFLVSLLCFKNCFKMSMTSYTSVRNVFLSQLLSRECKSTV